MSGEYQVHIEDRFEYFALDVYLYQRWGNGQVALVQPGGKRYVGPEGATIPEDQRIPVLRLPREAAPTLLGALARQLGAVEHPEQLRKDYDAERARVDKFIEHTLRGRP